MAPVSVDDESLFSWPSTTVEHITIASDVRAEYFMVSFIIENRVTGILVAGLKYERMRAESTRHFPMILVR